jgi:hypothetical protein
MHWPTCIFWASLASFSLAELTSRARLACRRRLHWAPLGAPSPLREPWTPGLRAWTERRAAGAPYHWRPPAPGTQGPGAAQVDALHIKVRSSRAGAGPRRVARPGAAGRASLSERRLHQATADSDGCSLYFLCDGTLVLHLRNLLLSNMNLVCSAASWASPACVV